MRDRWITDYEPSRRWPHYTRANAGEVMPSPVTPLCQKFTWDEGIIHGAAQGSCRTGLYEPHEYDPVLPEVFGFFGGYFYNNLANIRMQGVRNPIVTVEQLDTAFFGDHPDVPPYEEHPDDAKPHLTDGIMAHIGWIMSRTQWPELMADCDHVNQVRRERPDLTALSDAQLLERARSTLPDLVWGFDQHYMSSSSSGIAPGIFGVVGEAIGDTTIPMRLVAGLGDVDSAAPSLSLWELGRAIRGSTTLTALFDAGLDGLEQRLRSSHDAPAQDFVADFDAFLVEFGSRGPNEWEISAETWETKPALVLAMLDRIRLQDDDESPHRRAQARTAEREALTAEVRAKLSEIGNEELTGQFEAALVAANFMVYRERTKTNIIKTVHEGRMVFRELGRRHTAAGNIGDPFHVFMLLSAELDDFVADPASFADTLAERDAQWRQLADLEPPFIIADAQVPPLSEWPRKDQTTATAAGEGDVLTGLAGSPGVYTGRARVITDPGDPGALDPGDVMVAPSTDPGWTPLFMTAGAAVVNVGGQISHAIIVSRELGLPCVVSVEGATKIIPDGAVVEVDGNNGRVTVVELPQ
ncbi:PEP-utilizing enzyme [Candidatus Poriferisodalis sp.]|uniref:PEP-utilizing enzyme n=1 Tax=Candidatus Poriferisodalis sp. TaxID=3101277 RepID=UPI003B0225DD